MTPSVRDWSAIKEKIIAALRSGTVKAEWESISQFVNLPASTIRLAAQREWKIKKPTELMILFGEPPQKTGREIKQNKNTMEISDVAPLVRTLDQLLAACKVDRSVWDVKDYLVNQWQYGNADGKIYPLYQVKAWLVRKKLQTILPVLRPIEFKIAVRKFPSASSSDVKRALIIADPQVGFRRRLHTNELVPFHDRRVLDLALQIIGEDSFDSIHFIGDCLDMSEWSLKFTAEPEFYWTTQSALIEWAWWLAQYRQAEPRAEMFQFEGNHELRTQDALLSHVKAAYGLRPVDELDLPPSFSIDRLLALHKLGVTYIDGYPDNKHWLNQNVLIRHGDVVRAGPGDTAKAVVNKTTYTTIFGHIHRRELVSRRLSTRDGDIIQTAFCPGCACHIDGRVPGSSSEDQWQQGLGVIEYTDTWQSAPMAIAIENGRTIYNGKLFNARARDREINSMLSKKLKAIK